MSLSNDLTSWAAIVGILLPALVALLQRTGWSSNVNAMVFAVAVVIASIVYGYTKYQDNFTWKHWQEAFLAIIIYALATYHAYWKNGPVQKLRAIPIPPGIKNGNNGEDKK